jgi:hypothetical protein
LALWLGATVCQAQSTFGKIIGTVTDVSGAVVPGVSVQVTNQATNITRAVTADDTGNYEATHLHGGLYTVAAAKPGFKKFVHRDIRLEALATVRVDIQLEVGDVAVEVTVAAGAPVIETEYATVAQVRTFQQLRALPVNIRGGAPLYFWTWLTPTAYQGSGSSRAFGGGRRSMTYFNVDGISANSPGFGNQIGDLQPAQEAMQEVRFEYVGSKVEFGEIGNVIAITKSGGNRFQGSAFWNHVDKALAARSFFAPTRGPVDPRTGEEARIRHNELGGSLGGPLKRDRAFFFVAFEYNRAPTPKAVAPSVPTLRMRRGDFSELLALPRPIRISDPFTGQPFPGNLIPASLLYPGSVRYQDRFFPVPNSGPPESWSRNFVGIYPQEWSVSHLNPRIDYQFSPKHQLFGRLGLVRDMTHTLLGTHPPELVGYRKASRQGTQVMVSDTWTISPTLINEVRLGYSRRAENQQGALEGQTVIELLGIQGLPRHPGLTRIPDVQISGFDPVRPGGRAAYVEETFQAINQITKIQGAHSIKAGIEWRPQRYTGYRFPDFGVYNFTTRFTGFSYADFLLGLPQDTSRASQRDTLYARWWMLSGFVQDDFKVSPRLTLNYGVRWEFDRPLVDKFDVLSSFDLATGSLVVPTEAVRKKVPAAFPAQIPILTAAQAGFPVRSLRRNDVRNFAPRLGFALRPFASLRTAVRGGYGVFYESFTADLAGGFIVSHGPFDFRETFDNRIVGGAPRVHLERPFLERGTLGALDVRGMVPDIDNPYVQQVSLSLEQDVGFSTGLRISYIGTKSSKLVYRRNINQPPASPVRFEQSRRPYPLYRNILLGENGGGHTYHALSVQLERRAERGVYFQTNWTWAKNLTDVDETGGVEGGTTLENSYDRQRERGNSQFTPRHRLIAALIWELPVGRGKRFLNRPGTLDWVLGGWQLSSVWLAQTGQFLTPTFSGADPSNTNTTTGVPDRIGDGNLPKNQRTIDRWFDASAFVMPPNGRFGNCGRGILVGPGRNVLNLGLFKSFRIAERGALRFQITATNALNRPHFANPALNILAPGTVGRISAALLDRDFAGPREVVIGLRYQF